MRKRCENRQFFSLNASESYKHYLKKRIVISLFKHIERVFSGNIEDNLGFLVINMIKSDDILNLTMVENYIFNCL